MPLQGVWTADNDCLPPWKGDYHHDTNTELSYQSYLKANRVEEGEAFIEYLWKLKPTYERFAKEFFGVKGIRGRVIDSVLFDFGRQGDGRLGAVFAVAYDDYLGCAEF